MKNILLYKLTILNVLVFSWFFATDRQSFWFTSMYHSDTTGVSSLILLLWLLTLLATVYWAWIVNKQINRVKDYVAGKVADFDARFDDHVNAIEWIEEAAGWMLFLGLIGTLIGLRISIGGVNTGNVSNIEGLKSMAVQMITGLNIELTTTIIGSIAALWTGVNYSILKRHTKGLVAFEENIVRKV